MEPDGPTEPGEVRGLTEAAVTHREYVNDEDLLSPHAQQVISRLASGLGVLLVVALFFANLRRLTPVQVRSPANNAKVASRSEALAASLATSPYGTERRGRS